jgi:hypothetical protein
MRRSMHAPRPKARATFKGTPRAARGTLFAALALALASPFTGCGAGGCLLMPAASTAPHEAHLVATAPEATRAEGEAEPPARPARRAETEEVTPPVAAADPRLVASPLPSAEASAVAGGAQPDAPAPAAAERPTLPVPGTSDAPDPASLETSACFAFLDESGVRYRRAPRDGHEDFIALRGPIGGVEVEFVGRNQAHALMDCRVAAALIAWAPDLRAIGVRRLRHLSVYRQGAVVGSTGRPSGHAAGLAIDVRYLDFDDGHTLDVLEDWGDRTHDAEPCPIERYPDDPTPAIRALVCAAVTRGIFRTVITPHHDDPHQNHVHVEVVPGVDWTFVR